MNSHTFCMNHPTLLCWHTFGNIHNSFNCSQKFIATFDIHVYVLHHIIHTVQTAPLLQSFCNLITTQHSTVTLSLLMSNVWSSRSMVCCLIKSVVCRILHSGLWYGQYKPCIEPHWPHPPKGTNHALAHRPPNIITHRPKCINHAPQHRHAAAMGKHNVICHMHGSQLWQ